jgi:rSAM/selenodomain-associated transferase 1
MAKHWIPGQVKTRLARDTSDYTAAQIHRRFTLQLGEQLSATGDLRYIFTSPDEACGEMQASLGRNWIAAPQGGGDLGMRMARAFQYLFASGNPLPSRVILIGADLPTLTPGDLQAAFAELLQNDVVLGPATDGGYYLIGLRGPWRSEFGRLFEAIPWSTDDVFSITQRLTRNLGLTCSCLGIREDIDTVECLHRLLISDSIEQSLRDSIHALLDPAINPN